MIKAPEYGSNEKETIQNLMDAVSKMRKELNFILYNLDGRNIPQLPKIIGDIEANHTAIIQNENEIILVAQDVAQNTASISVQATQISLKVDSNGIIAAINLSPEVITLSAERIDLDGITRVSSQLILGQGTDNGTLTFKNGVSIYAEPGEVGIVINALWLQAPHTSVQSLFVSSDLSASTAVIGGVSYSDLVARVEALENV